MENIMKSLALLVCLTFFLFPFAQVNIDAKKGVSTSSPQKVITKESIKEDSIVVKMDSLKREVSQQLIKLEENNDKFNRELKENMDFSKKINSEMINVVNKLSKKVEDKTIHEIIVEIEKIENKSLTLDSVCVKKTGFLGTGKGCKKWELVLR